VDPALPTPPASPLRHPSERRGGPGRFEAIAEAISNLTASSIFFALCLLLVFGWIVALLVGLPQATDNDITGAMTALTLVLVAVLKNSERRAERAMQLKLDAIAAALLEERGERLDAETKTTLEDAVRLHEEI
jgi:low affinity Fe/Cu permease